MSRSERLLRDSIQLLTRSYPQIDFLNTFSGLNVSDPVPLWNPPPEKTGNADRKSVNLEIHLPSIDQNLVQSSMKDNISFLGKYFEESDEFIDRLVSNGISAENHNRREKCISFLLSEIKTVLRCSVFRLDSELIHLPVSKDSDNNNNDTIVLSISIGKAYSSSWTTILSEHLKEIGSLRGSTKKNKLKNGLGEHISIRNIECHSFPSPSLGFVIKGIPVIVRDDPLPTLCLYSFIEEISDCYFQQNHLLKRSFYLITLFLRNEIFPLLVPDTERETIQQTGLEEFLSEEMIWIMVLCVVNKSFSLIRNPLECLLFFLMEFSSSSSSSSSSSIPSVPSLSIFSIYGTIQIPMNSVSSGSSMTIPIQPNDYSISMDLIEKYRSILRPVTTTATESSPSLPNQMKIVFDSALPQFDRRFIAVHPLTHRVIASSKSFSVNDNNNNHINSNNNNQDIDSSNNNNNHTNSSNSSLSSIFQLGILRFQKLLNNNPSDLQAVKPSSRDHFQTILFPRSSKELSDNQLQTTPR
jgi:hypothetical protein